MLDHRPPNLSTSVTRSGAIAVVATLALAAACWLVALRRMSGMDNGVATELGSFGVFIAVWVPMMAAMMLPGAVPTVMRRARSVSAARSVALFDVLYLAVWAVVGIPVYALYRPHSTVTAGVLVIAAGIYELTPMKSRCRRRCRNGLRVRGVRVRLSRFEHRADGGLHRAGPHERDLDGDRRRRHGRSKDLSCAIRRRRAGRARDCFARRPRRRHATVDSRPDVIHVNR